MLEGPGLGAAAAAGDSPVRRGSRDDGAFYQAEAAMLTRENQLLRQRIRELGEFYHLAIFLFFS